MGERIARAAGKVRQHWEAQGLRVCATSESDIVALRRRLRAEIPLEYEIFVRLVGLPDQDDSNGFRMWALHEIRPTRDVLRDAGYEYNAADTSVVIADYLQQSWWYVLWLDGPRQGCVSLALGTKDGSDPQPPFGTFLDFLDAYTEDNENLYPR